jgi:hypothetical protein
MAPLEKSRVKFAARFFCWILWPFMWLSPFAGSAPKSGPSQLRYNWQILS